MSWPYNDNSICVSSWKPPAAELTTALTFQWHSSLRSLSMGHSARAWESAFLLTQSQGTPRLLLLGAPEIAKGGVEGEVGGEQGEKGRGRGQGGRSDSLSAAL